MDGDPSVAQTYIAMCDVKGTDDMTYRTLVIIRTGSEAEDDTMMYQPTI